MPQVPVYNGPQVQTRALQPVFQREIDVSSGTRAIGQAIGQVGEVIDRKVQRDAQAEADQVDAEITSGWLEWDAQNRRKYQGEKAGDYEVAATEWWNKVREQYGPKLSPIARERLGTTLERKRASAMAAVLARVGEEKDRHAVSVYDAAQGNEIELGIDTGNPAGAAANVRKRAAEFGAGRGWNTDQVEAEVQKRLGTLHLAYITRLAESNPEKATEYYEANKVEIPGTAQAKVEQVLKGERDNKFATQFAAQHAGLPLSEQLAKAGEITDPDRREKALQQIKNNHAMVQQAQREREQAASDEAWQLASQGRKVPEAVLSRMNGRERAQLKDWLREKAKQAAEGTPTKTDWATYIDARERLFAGENVDLRPLTTKIAGPQLEQLLDIKTKVKDAKKAPEVASAEQQIGTYIDTMKLSGSNDQEKRGQFKAAAQDLFNEHLKRTGKEPTFDERQKILDQLTVEVVTKPGWLWDTKGPAYALPRDQLRSKVRADQFEVGKVYVDGKGVRAKYLGAGKWEPVK